MGQIRCALWYSATTVIFTAPLGLVGRTLVLFFTHGFVASRGWMDRRGNNFSVLHQFTATEGHAASLLRHAAQMFLWLRGVACSPRCPWGRCPPAVVYRMPAIGGRLRSALYVHPNERERPKPRRCRLLRAARRDAAGRLLWRGEIRRNKWQWRGVQLYSLSNPSVVEIVHDFSAINSAGENSDGANPYARLSIGHDGTLYSTASYGGANGNGVVYRIRP